MTRLIFRSGAIVTLDPEKDSILLTCDDNTPDYVLDYTGRVISINVGNVYMTYPYLIKDKEE